MSLLPIVDRELRVASRQWSTYLIRAGVGMLALLVLVPGLFFGWVTSGNTGAGQNAFSSLSHYAFVIGLLGGVLITADCLSSEKRDGTLGLLFLTDLRGYDVVLGKFAALALHAIYGMVAVFPALALPILMGGVTGAEFWRVALALANLLFVSLSVGMMVSAVSRDASKVFFSTFVILLLLVAGIPLGTYLSTRLGLPNWIENLAWINPGHAFAVGKSTSIAVTQEYWISLACSHGLGWSLLVSAAIFLPRSWQNTETRGSNDSLAGRLLGPRVASVFRCRRPHAWLNQNPVAWLMGDRPVLRMLVWIIAGGWCMCVIAACLFIKPEDLAASIVMGGWIVLLVLKLALIEHTCRFWVEGRRSGSLESLLAVPLTTKEILSSHWASIRRHFLAPAIAIIVVSMVPLVLALISEFQKSGATTDMVLGFLFSSGFLGFALVWSLADFLAIGWTGMWLALKLKRPQFASGITLLCVVLLPMMLCWLGIGLSLVFIFLPMSLLQSNLRGMILQNQAPVLTGIGSARSD